MRRALLAFLVALALTGCTPAPGSARSTQPPGGWPQPAGKWLTERMCGLLTKADYTSHGHARQPDDTINALDNSVDCHYPAGEEMTLSLKPTAEFAKYVFGTGLQLHRDRLTAGHRRSELARDVVGVADESWFDMFTATLGSTSTDPEIQVRRGALILDITLGGARGKDPRGVLTKLAGLVLRRLPHVGAKDAGTNHTIEYEVVGTGRAATLEWEDYTDFKHGGFLSNPRLPWVRTVQMAVPPGAVASPVSLSVRTSSPNTKVGCQITVDGTPVAADGMKKGYVDCEGPFPDQPDFPDGGGDGSPAQPASTGPFGAGSSHEGPAGWFGRPGS